MTGPGITAQIFDTRDGGQRECNWHERGTSQTTVDVSCELSIPQVTELERRRRRVRSVLRSGLVFDWRGLVLLSWRFRHRLPIVLELLGPRQRLHPLLAPADPKLVFRATSPGAWSRLPSMISASSSVSAKTLPPQVLQKLRPLCVPTSPVDSKAARGQIAKAEKNEPLTLRQFRQWQSPARDGWPVNLNRTAPHRRPPGVPSFGDRSWQGPFAVQRWSS